jgi:GGDEF domain-containing protein
MHLIFSPDVFALGLAVGVLGLVLVLSLIISYAYDERTLLFVAAYTGLMVGLAYLVEVFPSYANLIQKLLLVVGPSLTAGLMMLLLKNRRLSKIDKTVMAGMVLISLGLMAFYTRDARTLAAGGNTALALGLSLVWFVLLVGASVYLAIQSWDSAGPWKWWLLTGHTLGFATAMLFLPDFVGAKQAFWPVVLMLVLQCPPIYLAMVWRSRLLNEVRLRSSAANVADPLTGLATTPVLLERIMRIMSRPLQSKQGPASSALYLVQVQNWNGLLNELGLDFNEKLLLESALRLRRSIGDNDMVARISGGRFAVLAQGLTDFSEVGSLATRLVVSGLRIDSPLLPGVELQFRVIVRPMKFGSLRSLPAAAEFLEALAARFGNWPSSHRSRSILVVNDESARGDFSGAPAEQT